MGGEARWSHHSAHPRCKHHSAAEGSGSSAQCWLGRLGAPGRALFSCRALPRTAHRTNTGAMQWPDNCEALEEAVAAEIAGAILDVAIARCRNAVDGEFREYKYLVAREHSAERHLRDARSEVARACHENRMHYFRVEANYCAVRWARWSRTYRQDREWQNRRYGLPPGSEDSQLPWQARQLGDLRWSLPPPALD